MSGRDGGDEAEEIVLSVRTDGTPLVARVAATPQPTPSAAPRTLQCAACGGHNTTAHNGPDGPLTKCVDCTEEIMIPGAQPPTPIAAPSSGGSM